RHQHVGVRLVVPGRPFGVDAVGGGDGVPQCALERVAFESLPGVRVGGGGGADGVDHALAGGDDGVGDAAFPQVVADHPAHGGEGVGALVVVAVGGAFDDDEVGVADVVGDAGELLLEAGVLAGTLGADVVGPAFACDAGGAHGDVEADDLEGLVVGPGPGRRGGGRGLGGDVEEGAHWERLLSR